FSIGGLDAVGLGGAAFPLACLALLGFWSRRAHSRGDSEHAVPERSSTSQPMNVPPKTRWQLFREGGIPAVVLGYVPDPRPMSTAGSVALWFAFGFLTCGMLAAGASVFALLTWWVVFVVVVGTVRSAMIVRAERRRLGSRA